jgi:hypothetical protein
MSGPSETEREAAAAARHVYDTDAAPGAWRDGSLRMLEDACRAAGVQLGAYDHRILVWLAAYEPSTCAVSPGSSPAPAVEVHSERHRLFAALRPALCQCQRQGVAKHYTGWADDLTPGSASTPSAGGVRLPLECSFPGRQDIVRVLLCRDQNRSRCTRG